MTTCGNSIECNRSKKKTKKAKEMYMYREHVVCVTHLIDKTEEEEEEEEEATDTKCRITTAAPYY
jgi:hypothetical protein